MRPQFLAVASIFLAGCMCRTGVVDCTTQRAYPGYCKPLCGGPLDPFVWLTGDCSTCCCCSYKCGYTPYGGRTVCGDDMRYTPSCVAPPLQWAPPAVPTPPGGHVVHNPPPLLPPSPSRPVPPPAPATKSTVPPAPPASRSSSPEATPSEAGSTPPAATNELDDEEAHAPEPSVLHDARHDEPLRSRL